MVATACTRSTSSLEAEPEMVWVGVFAMRALRWLEYEARGCRASLVYPGSPHHHSMRPYRGARSSREVPAPWDWQFETSTGGRIWQSQTSRFSVNWPYGTA